MSVSTIFEIVLAAVVLGLGIWTTAVRDTYSATVGFVVYGLLVALIWVRLDAVDVALTEAAISGGLGGVLLLGAAARLQDAKFMAADTPGKLACVSAAALSLLAVAALMVAVFLLPDSASTLAPAVVANACTTGLTNPVTNVLMAFRAMDTMLEKVVLLLALVGVWSLAPDGAWGGHPGPRHQADANGVLVFLARLLPPIGMIVGIYIFWTGADHPGGAFQGGAILASMWLLAIMAGLTDTPPVNSQRLRLLLIAGPGLFLAVGLGGFWSGAAFLSYSPTLAKPLILGIEIAMIVTITTTLALLLAGTPERSAQQ